MKKVPYYIILVLVCLVLWLWLKPTKQPINLPIGVAPTSEPTIIKEYVDKEGKSHIVYLPVKVTQSDLRDENKPLGIIDTAAEALNIAREQIISIKKLVAITKDSLLQAKIQLNKLNQKVARYEDKFIALSYNYSDSTFAYNANTEATIVDYMRKSWFLGKNKTYVDVSVANGTSSLKTYTIEPKQYKNTFTLSGSSLYDLNDNHLSLGGKVTVDIGRVGINGSYLYQPSLKIWKPYIGLDFRVGGF